MKGDIILIPFPFTDLTTSKRRPVLVIRERGSDVVVIFISSVIPAVLENCHLLITSKHPEFAGTGLKVDSVFYLDKIATLTKKFIVGKLGQVGSRLKRRVNRQFPSLFKL